MKTQTTPHKRKRKAVWRTCAWCQRRLIDPPFRSGKLKCLERHMAGCKAEFLLQQETKQEVDTACLKLMISGLQRQISELHARVSVLEKQGIAKMVKTEDLWAKISPKKAWQMAKKSTVRAIRSVIKSYDSKGPCPSLDLWLEWNILQKEPTISHILSIALWPIIDIRNGKACLKNIETEDMYCIFKQLWGKKQNMNQNLMFYKEALVECDLSLDDFYDAHHFNSINEEFQRRLCRFQNAPKKAGSGNVCQDLVGLVRVWRNVFQLDESITQVCTSLPPNMVLMLDK